MLVMSGCAGNSPKIPELSFRDSVAYKFLSLTDSVYYYDTSDFTYRIFKAYVNNDTSFLAGAKKMIDLNEKSPDFDGHSSCIHPQRLSDLHAEEAYRFEISRPFCHFAQIVTISKSGDANNLEYIEFIPADAGRKKQEFSYQGEKLIIDSNCIILKKVSRGLTDNEWDQLENALLRADYWGLKTHVSAYFLDPAVWVIYGHKKDNFQSHSTKDHKVVRIPPTSNDFIALGLLFLKLAGEKSSCRND